MQMSMEADVSSRKVRFLSQELTIAALKPEDIAGASMKGYRRYLSQVAQTDFCHIAFSMNANLRGNSSLRDICKRQPGVITAAHNAADKMIPKLVGKAVEEGTCTFVLDMSKNGEYMDRHGRDGIADWEAKVAEFLRKPGPKGESAIAETHRRIRPWMSFFIAEGSVKCELLRLMSSEERNWLQTDANGKILLCMMGLVVIHFLQYGFTLFHEPSNIRITPAGVFHDLEEDDVPTPVDSQSLLAMMRQDFKTMTMFPGEHYAKAYCEGCQYVNLMANLTLLRYAKHLGHGELQIHDIQFQAEEISKPVHLAAKTVQVKDVSDSEPSAIVVLRGLLDSKGGWETPTTQSESDAVSQEYSPEEVILAGTLNKSQLSLEDKIACVKLVCSNGGELIGEDQLALLFTQKEHPVCYDGFEPSGRMHIAQGILKAINVNRLTNAGCVFVFWVADWFALLNNKMDGDLQKIQTVGRYFVEVWKAAGMNMDNVRFLWAEEEINKNPDRYWMLVMNIARAFTLARVKRCSQIMGRSEGDEQAAATIMYPCMQAADVFYLGADICQLGMDQRKVNMLAREYLDRPGREKREKPIVASHGMIPGLLEGQEKMSKSDPDSAIFMEDSIEDVERKIKKAYCPPKQIESNPCVAYARHLIFPKDGCLIIRRSQENGGDVTFTCVEELETAYLQGEVHPSDLKKSLADTINKMIEPVREHFRKPGAAKLLDTVRRYRVTK